MDTITVVKDAFGTPSDVTCFPFSERYNEALNEDISEWRADESDVPLDAQINVVATRRKLKSGLTRVGVTVNYPVLEVATGTDSSGYAARPKVAYVQSVQIVEYVHPRSTTSARRNSRIGAACVLLDKGASDVPSSTTTGQLVRFLDKLAMY